MEHILITGATGQIGSELTLYLRQKYGNENVIAVGHSKSPDDALVKSGPYESLDATDKVALNNVLEKYKIDTIYHLVGILSAKGEEQPDLAWNVNMGSLKNILDLAVERKISKLFWPSSIAAFGPTTPRENTPQQTILEPNTMYGITKVSGELLCSYYHKKFGLDVRSLRYPGLISYKTPPGGGTTDYACAIYFEAVRTKKYTCFVSKETMLPMMYMPDALKATVELMEADESKISIRSSYNITAMSFSAEELTEEVVKLVPGFACEYIPDHHQKIADSWPRSIDDSVARHDWGWKPEYGLEEMSRDMIDNIKKIE